MAHGPACFLKQLVGLESGSGPGRCNLLLALHLGLIHSFLHLIFTEQLLGARHWVVKWGWVGRGREPGHSPVGGAGRTVGGETTVGADTSRWGPGAEAAHQPQLPGPVQGVADGHQQQSGEVTGWPAEVAGWPGARQGWGRHQLREVAQEPPVGVTTGLTGRGDGMTRGPAGAPSPCQRPAGNGRVRASFCWE